MGFLKRLFGQRKQQPKQERQSAPEPEPQSVPEREPQFTPEPEPQSAPEPEASGILGILQSSIKSPMEILRFLCTCGKPDRGKMETYLAMAEKSGIKYEPQDRDLILNATLLMPKRLDDGTVADGYEQVRRMLVGNQVDAISQVITVFKSQLTDPASASYVKRLTNEMQELAGPFT